MYIVHMWETGGVDCDSRQASLRYRELNDALESVQQKIGDARVSVTIFIATHRLVCKYVYT